MDDSRSKLEEAGDAAPRPARRGAGRGALTLMGGTLASRVTGLLRNSLLTQFFSQGVSDAFLTAFKVPNLFRELLAEGALTNSFIPVYNGLDREERRRLTGALLGLLLLVNGVLLLAAYAAAPLLARVLIGDAGNVDPVLTAQLVRVVFPFLVTISLSALAMGVLNAEERFLAPAWAPVALNVVTVSLMALFPGQAVMLAAAHVLGGLAQLLVQVPALARLGLLPRALALWHPALAGVLLLMAPFALTSGGRQVLNVVASNVLTAVDKGAQTAFYNADLFLSLALGLFSISPALAYYSRLSDNAVNEPAAFAPTLLEGLRFIAFLTVPAGLALAVLAEPATHLIFSWRSLGSVAAGDARVALTAAAAGPLGLAVFPIGLSNLLVRTFYLRRRVLVPVLVVLPTLALQGALYVLLSGPYGVVGVAWATVAASWVQFALLLVLVARSEAFGAGALLSGAARAWLAGLGGAGAALVALAWLPRPEGWWGHVPALLGGAAVLGGVYLLLGAALGLPVARRAVRALFRLD